LIGHLLQEAGEEPHDGNERLTDWKNRMRTIFVLSSRSSGTTVSRTMGSERKRQ
jgi:hypothetical protein